MFSRDARGSSSPLVPETDSAETIRRLTLKHRVSDTDSSAQLRFVNYGNYWLLFCWYFSLEDVPPAAKWICLELLCIDELIRILFLLASG